MKTAILISGELRTFSICRPTMTFLDDPNAEIYVSTWDRSIVKNERINLFINDEVSEDNILKILNRPATIMVEPLSCIEEKKYNSKIIHRWLAGFQMILDSKQDYDYVLVTRPDLYFNHTHPCMFTLDSLILDGDKQFAWYEEGHKLQDNLFFAKFSTMKELFAKLFIKDWEESQEFDLLTWWTKIVGWTEIKRLGGHVQFTFCRPIVKKGMSFQEVFNCYLDWRGMQIMTQVEQGNRDVVVKDWGETEVLKAEEKSFEHYRVTKPVNSTAILVCGMMRQSDIAMKSWWPLNDLDADWYLSTWDTSTQSDSYVEFKPIINEEFLNKFNKFKIHSYESQRSEFDKSSNMIRCGVNSSRYLYLLDHFSVDLSKYDNIIIIRPDTYLDVLDIAKFREECSEKNVLISSIVKHNFIQDFMLITTGVFFENLSLALDRAKDNGHFNPHTQWLRYADDLHLNAKQSASFAVILVRPNSRKRNIHTFTSIFNDWVEWKDMHSH